MASTALDKPSIYCLWGETSCSVSNCILWLSSMWATDLPGWRHKSVTHVCILCDSMNMFKKVQMACVSRQLMKYVHRWRLRCVTFIFVSGHTGDNGNVREDCLASLATGSRAMLILWTGWAKDSRANWILWPGNGKLYFTLLYLLFCWFRRWGRYNILFLAFPGSLSNCYWMLLRILWCYPSLLALDMP